MKLKVSYTAYTQKEIEVDEKWDRFIRISKKRWDNMTDKEQDYYNANANEFAKDIDLQMGFDDWDDITTMDGSSIFED